MADLSVIIPARNEMFLKETVEDVLKNSELDTEVIVICDGSWPVYPIDDHPKVTIIYRSESIGQRAACNEGVRISTADYIMKLDAHCALDKGFDRKLIASAQELGNDVTQIPTQYNLHVFDWVCADCHYRKYQGPTPVECEKCKSQNVSREMIWQPRLSRKTQSWRFDEDLHFQYWNDYLNRPEAKQKYIDTMSCLGACWFMSKSRYWELGGMDEDHGSWGQMGTELGCKSWLSGGRMVTNTTTWFAHMFRTQGGDFSFPYPLSNSDVKKAREHSKKLWMENKWPGAIHNLDWLLNKFKPVPGWHEMPTKGIIYYTDNKLNLKIAHKVQKNLKKIGLPIVSASLKPMNFGSKNIVLNEKRGYLTMFKQIYSALEALDTDIVFFCEHDVLYHPTHFSFNPTDENTWYYNTNVWKLNTQTGLFVRTKDCRQVSGIAVYRKLALEHYKKRIEILEDKKASFSDDKEFSSYVRRMGFEPGTHNRNEKVDNAVSATWESDLPNIDIRHENNTTASRWDPAKFRNKKYTEGWTEQYSIDGWSPMRDKDTLDISNIQLDS